MDVYEFSERIFLNLPYEPTAQQIELIAALSRFCSAQTPSDSVFLLAGYAGTGKTSLVGALVRTLREVQVPVALMAPTGRAAKVFGAFARYPATTIHRRIYRHSQLSGPFDEAVADNPYQNAVFIVDEASMIGNGGGGGDSESRSSLLEDLVHYVYSGENCRMILLGDTAQLPPVGCTISPAMNPEVLKKMGLRVSRAVMTEVVRQRGHLGILYNATWLRRAMLKDPLPTPQMLLSRFEDIETVAGEDLIDSISSAYSRDGQGETIVITRSNRRATQYNLGIRAQILGREEELCRDERLLVVKNNYLWSGPVKGLDFIANGDVAIVAAIHGTEEKYGLRFADVTLTLADRDVDVECKIVLDTLTGEGPSLDTEKFERLYKGILYDPDLFSPSTPMDVRVKTLRTDPYFNALWVKYAYALTCHKSQGGQWKNVYVDMGYIPPEAQGIDFYRWLYTSVTRASERLYLINPDEALIK